MVSINLYQPKNFDYAIDFPSAWNELTVKELFAVCKHQLAKFLTIEEQLTAIFHDLLNIRCHKRFKLPKNYFGLLSAEDVATNLVSLLSFLYTENKLTEQLLPTLILPGSEAIEMKGPESDFNNLTCGEFEDAEIFFHEFINTPKAESLSHLTAILWRPQDEPYLKFNKEANTWQTYNHEKVLNKFLRLKPHVLYACFVWYAGCRAMLPLYFQSIYKKGTTKKESEVEQPDLLAFTKCIHAGAGAKNGSRTDIRRTLLKEFFMEMELEAQEAEKIKAEYGNK